MESKITLFNDELELKNIKGWKERIENPEVTHLLPVFGKKPTRYNKWCQPLEYEKLFTSTKIKFFVGRQKNHIHALQHATLFTNLEMENVKNVIKRITLLIKTTNNETTLFDFDFDEYVALLNLLNIEKDMFFVPFQYFVFGKELFLTCKEHFVGFELLLETTSHISLFTTRIDGMCYTVGKHELNRFLFTSRSYFVNKYITIETNINNSTGSLDLNYCQPIRSITAFNYATSNDICVSIDDIPFYGSYNNCPHFYDCDEEQNFFEYLSEIDKQLYSGLIANCEKHMYYKTFDQDAHFMDVNDCYNKMLPTNKLLHIESACGSNIGKIRFLIQFMSELQCDEYATYAQCINFPIKNNPNSNPLTKLSDNVFVEGYWQEYNECGCCNKLKYPFPVESETKVNEIFLQNLEHIKKYCKIDCYFGSSYCRLCNICNGGNEYSFTLSNGNTYKFPEGLVHYYQVHNVQPSDIFVEAVEEYVVELDIHE